MRSSVSTSSGEFALRFPTPRLECQGADRLDFGDAQLVRLGDRVSSSRGEERGVEVAGEVAEFVAGAGIVDGVVAGGELPSAE